MNLEGLEMIAVLVVVVLFVKVLERFGLLAAIYDGKEMANSFHTWRGGGLSSSLQQSATCCPSFKPCSAVYIRTVYRWSWSEVSAVIC